MSELPATKWLRPERAAAAKLDWDAADRIRAMIAGGLKNKDIARQMGVSQHAVIDIKMGRTWRPERRP